MFENIVGQETAKKTIGSMIETGRIPHALLFVGSYGVGKGETALDLARMLLCENGPGSGCSACSSCNRSSKIEHPDLHVLFPFRAPPKTAEKYGPWADELVNHKKVLAGELYAPIVYEKGRQIVVDLVREVNERLQESSFEGGRKVCVILNADRLNDVTSNTMLKILEEPPDGVHFILTAERLSSVLPTITSRSSVVRFRRLTETEIAAGLENMFGVEPDSSISNAAMAEGSLKTAKAFAFENKADVRTKAFDLYRTIASGRTDEVVTQVLPYVRSRDVVEAEELIGGFTLFTRSILKKKYGIAFRNGGCSEIITALSDVTDLFALRNLSVKLEESLEMLGRNVNISTVLTSIFYEINDTYKYQKH